MKHLYKELLMYNIILDDSETIEVTTRKHQYRYATNGSLPNPLEATFAALAGCAAVYLKKAALKMNKSVIGTEIKCRSLVNSQNPLVPAKWITQVNFSDSWTTQERQQALALIEQCAVKELITKGYDIEFEIHQVAYPQQNDIVI